MASTNEHLASQGFGFPEGELDRIFVETWLRPLFAEHAPPVVYLANHSLGRMLKAVPESLEQMTRLWGQSLDRSWEQWTQATWEYRSTIARLIQAESADRVVPKTSTGQGVRAVLNALHAKLRRPVRVLATRGEFDSADFILKVYSKAGIVALDFVEPDRSGEVPLYSAEKIAAKVDGHDLVVVSQVLFETGQVLEDIDLIAEAAHQGGGLLLVDTYHSLGVIEVDMQAAKADFAVGGCYKYLRGGPGACFLYLAPHIDNSDLMPLDTGWFAKQDVFGYQRSDEPQFAEGGDGWLESTPAIAPIYQALPGLRFYEAIGASRNRAYVLKRLEQIQLVFEDQGIGLFKPSRLAEFGAFALLSHPKAGDLVSALSQANVTVDARSGFVRFGPDVLTTDEEIIVAAKETKRVIEDN